jgi:hypothetical protein
VRPGLEPLATGAERADARLHAVGDDERRIRGEERGDLCLIGVKLLERGPDRRVLVGRIFQLDDSERQPVHEQHDVRAAGVLPVCHGKLVDREPVVVVRHREVDHARLRAGNGPVGTPVLHRHAVHEHPVHRAIALDKRRSVGACELAICIFQRLGRQPWIEPHERIAQSLLQYHLGIASPLPLGIGIYPPLRTQCAGEGEGREGAGVSPPGDMSGPCRTR